jgi:hypothetical protein
MPLDLPDYRQAMYVSAGAPRQRTAKILYLVSALLRAVFRFVVFTHFSLFSCFCVEFQILIYRGDAGDALGEPFQEKGFPKPLPKPK